MAESPGEPSIEASIRQGFRFPMRPSVPRMLPATPAHYLIQTKYDGWNVVIGGGRIWTRRGNEITDWCTDWGFDLAPPVMVNGELQALEAGELADRADIQGIRTGRCRPVVRVFDAMLEGPGLEERLEIVRSVASDSPIDGSLEVAVTTEPGGLGGTWADVNRLLDDTLAAGHEGLILKRRESLYYPSREVSVVSEDWLKLKVPVAELA